MLGRYITTYGFDPSLRHGCLVKATTMIVEDGSAMVVSADIVYAWTQRSELTLTEKSTPYQVYLLVGDIVRHMPSPQGLAIGVDYDDRAAYWTKRPGQVAKLQFLSGYFSHAMQTLGLPVIMLSPHRVRSLMGLDLKAKKPEVWNAFIARSQVYRGVSPAVIGNEDARDALILAYLISFATQEHMNVARTTSTNLLSDRAQAADAIHTALTPIAPRRPDR